MVGRVGARRRKIVQQHPRTRLDGIQVVVLPAVAPPTIRLLLGQLMERRAVLRDAPVVKLAVEPAQPALQRRREILPVVRIDQPPLVPREELRQ